MGDGGEAVLSRALALQVRSRALALLVCSRALALLVLSRALYQVEKLLLKLRDGFRYE